MRTKIFSIYDSKISAFGVPFFAPHDEVAFRHMRVAVQERGTHLAAFPQDFHLFELGEFDDQSAEFDLLVSPKAHGPLSQFLEAIEK